MVAPRSRDLCPSVERFWTNIVPAFTVDACYIVQVAVIDAALICTYPSAPVDVGKFFGQSLKVDRGIFSPGWERYWL